MAAKIPRGAAALAPAADGLAIQPLRPQTLQLAPRYRRLRDAILRPHLRLTESRYFWERWKSRLGPDAAILIMEVRDRCNRALAAAATSPEASPRSTLDQHAAEGGEFNTLDTAPEGCTVSAGDLAAACGFSRVTLWRILQRDDVRRFIQVEHNYVYDRRLGKKRRTISTYRVLMEDPLVEEDEARLQEMLGAAGAAQDTAPAHQDLPKEASYSPYPPASTVQFESKVVDNPPPRLQIETAESGCNLQPGNVQETILRERSGNAGNAHPIPAARPNASKAAATTGGANGTVLLRVDLWRDYPEFAHHVEEAERLLGDTHSRGFYIKALKRLHPGHMGIWQRALGMAREQQNIRRSRGALFTRLLRTFAAEAGVQL